MTYGLTKRQSDCLQAIREYVERTGRPPSYDDLAQALGLVTRSAVHGRVKRLKQRGWITYIPAHSRSIALVDHPSAPVRGEAA